jgi:iron complex outermembrane recepter protein
MTGRFRLGEGGNIMRALGNHRRNILAAGVSACALLVASPAIAQIEDIVVTAQKVEQKLQDVPVAVSAVSGDQLAAAGANSLENIGRLVPSITFRKGTTSANSAIFMRGVGTITFSVAAEPSVSTVVDGVVLSRSGQSFISLLDIERIEALRGPQGTLFGKNASAGLVNIVSKGGTSSSRGEATVEYYEGSEFRIKGAVSGPLGGDWTGRLTGFYGSYDGNITNIYGGKNEKVNGYDQLGFRAIADYDNEGTKIRLIADYFRANDDCCADVTAVSRGAVIDSELALPGGAAQGEAQRYINHNLVTRTRDRQWSLTANGDFEVSDSHTLSLILGYRNWWNQELREGDFLPRAFLNTTVIPNAIVNELHDTGVVKTQQISAEVRLASDPDAPLFYQVGGIFWHSNNKQDFTRRNVACSTSTLAVTAGGARPCNITDTVNTLFPTATSFSDVDVDNYAAFGQLTYKLTEQLSVTGGLRVTQDKLAYTHTRAPSVNATNGQPATSGGLSGSPAGGTIAGGGNGTNTSAGRSSNTNVSGKASIQFKATEDVLLYASYTRGYKGPAFNVFFNHTAPVNAIPIDAETSNSFEAGFKSQFWDNKAQLNVAAFTVEYDGFQANNFVILNGATVSNLTNAGTVQSRGFEIDAILNPVNGLTLRANAAYADAKVKKFNPNPSTNAPDARNGTRLPLAPEFSYTLGADYEAPLGPLTLYLGSDFRHVSSQFSDLGNSGPINSYGLWNASIGLSDADDKYRLTFHARNIMDHKYILLNVSAGQRYQIPRDADRYFGASLRAKF